MADIQGDSDQILHQTAVEGVVEDVLDGPELEESLGATSTQVHIPNAVVAVAAPTKAEFDALVAKFNLVLGVLRDASLLPSS